MASIRIDNAISEMMKAASKKNRLKGRALSWIMNHSLIALMEKTDDCSSCDNHRRMVADLELRRQKIARKSEGDKKQAVAWITLNDDIYKRAQDYANGYRRSVKIVAEQAVLEFLMRQRYCPTCPVIPKPKQTKKDRKKRTEEEGTDEQLRTSARP